MTEYERACRETVVTYAIKLRAMLMESGLYGVDWRPSPVEAIRDFLYLDEEALEHLGPLREALGLGVHDATPRMDA